jgi:hypothetical protein
MTGTADSAHRFDWLAGVTTLLAILACYGTIVLIGALSLLGMTLALHEGAWAGAVSLVRTSDCLPDHGLWQRGVTLSERGGVLQ